jgi:hypothetical protein
LTTRLVAATSVIDRALQQGLPQPTLAEASDFLLGAHHLNVGLTRIAIAIGQGYGPLLPADVLEEFRLAVRHMQAVRLTAAADAFGGPPSGGDAQRR